MTDKLCPCGNKAKYLCDARVPLTEAEKRRRRTTFEKINRQTVTCDAPLCDGCRVRVGSSTFCSRGGKGCESDSIDHCRKCVVKIGLGLA